MSRKTIAFACLLFAVRASAGTVLEVERRNQDGEIDSTITAYVQDGRLRFDQVDEERQRSSLIYDGERLIDVDISAGSYAVIERSRIERARRTPDPQQTLRGELLAEVPAARRGDSISMLSRPPLSIGPVHNVQKNVPTARFATHAGMDCRVYQVLFNGHLRYEYCMAMPVPAQLAGFVASSAQASDLVRQFYDTLGAPWLSDALQLYWAHVYDIEGAPLSLREYEDDALVSEFRIVTINKRPLDAGQFGIPHGLRKRAVLDFSAPPNAPGVHDESP